MRTGHRRRILLLPDRSTYSMTMLDSDASSDTACMSLGAGAVFVGSGIFKSADPAVRAKDFPMQGRLGLLPDSVVANELRSSVGT